MKPCKVDAQKIAAIEVPSQSPLRGAAVVLVVCVDLNVVAAFDQHLDRVGLIAGASVYPFVWNILLAARNEGYGGVLTTVAVAEEPRVKELLGIPDDLRDRRGAADGQTEAPADQAQAQGRHGDRDPGALRRRPVRRLIRELQACLFHGGPTS